ncbi:hypothetical protein EBX93_13295 [bacterium]|nr:hypothetical protein [bacterium]
MMGLFRVKISAIIIMAFVSLNISFAMAEDDLLARARQLREIAIQKKENETKMALNEALRLSKISLARAAEYLKPILDGIENDELIPAEKRDSLARVVRAQIKVYEKNVGVSLAKSIEAAQSQAQINERLAEIDRSARENEKLSRNLDSIKNLRRDGFTAEANRNFEELARKYPNNPEIQAYGRMNKFQDNISAESKLRSTRSEMMLALQRDILKASIPVTGEMVFPDDWVEKSKRRTSGSKLTEDDRKIMKTMSSPLTFSLKNEPFQSFLDIMEKQFGSPLVIDQQALQLLNITTETPITINARGWSTRTILRKVLSDLGLSYVIKDKSINITTPDRARETMTTRAYPIGDIIGNMNMNLPNTYNQSAFIQNVQNIINSIMALDPKSWQPEGAGSIVFEPSTMSLIIRQTAEFHFMVGSGR